MKDWDAFFRLSVDEQQKRTGKRLTCPEAEVQDDGDEVGPKVGEGQIEGHSEPWVVVEHFRDRVRLVGTQQVFEEGHDSVAGDREEERREEEDVRDQLLDELSRSNVHLGPQDVGWLWG